jgi:hypothetical protein
MQAEQNILHGRTGGGVVFQLALVGGSIIRKLLVGIVQ